MEQLLCAVLQTALELTSKSINRGAEADSAAAIDQLFTNHYAAIVAAINANPLQETVVPRVSDPQVRSVG